MANSGSAKRSSSTRNVNANVLDTVRPWMQIAIALIFFILVVLDLTNLGNIADRIDSTLLALVALAAIAVLAPWHRLESFKGAGVEMTWSADTPQLEGALRGIDVKPDDNTKDRLRDRIWRRREDVQAIGGSRVLWVDDKPHEILAERRILRALRIEIVSETSTAGAVQTLRRDNDFDLIITDRVRRDEPVPNAGILLVKKLDRDFEDQHIKTMPVIFYSFETASDIAPELVDLNMDNHRVEMTRSVVDLVSKVIDILADVRSQPIKYPVEKRPT